MADRSGKFLPVGMRFACVFELDSNGRPKAVTTAAYTGLRWSGPKTFELSIPQSRILSHPGADRVLRTAVLPTLETPSGNLRVSDYRFDIQSVLAGINVGHVGEAAEFAHMTSQQGHEPVVGLLCYQQSQDLDTGLLTWHSYILPKCRLIQAPAGMSEVGEIAYSIVPTPTTQRLWGVTLVKATDGYTDTPIFEYDSEGILAVVSFLADGTETTFDFPAGEEALSVDKIFATRNGVAVSSGMTPAVTGITFSSPPTKDDVICVKYEMASTVAASESV